MVEKGNTWTNKGLVVHVRNTTQACYSPEKTATHYDKIAHLLKRDSIYQHFPFCRYMPHLSQKIRGVSDTFLSPPVAAYSTQKSIHLTTTCLSIREHTLTVSHIHSARSTAQMLFVDVVRLLDDRRGG